MKRYIYIITIFLSAVTLSSCDDFFDVDPDDVLLGGDYPSTVTELYSGFFGLTSTVQAVADQSIFLEGLRGDLLEPTANATDDVINLYNYGDMSSNKLADPVKYYEVILNVNDYIQHAADFYSKFPTSIEESTFEALIGGAIRYKCWAYLMLAKIYGEAVWVNDPLIEYKDISGLPLLDVNAIVLKCINAIEKGVELKGGEVRFIEDGSKIEGKQITGMKDARWSVVIFNQSQTTASEWNRICPPAEVLLSELYLYAEQYQKVLDWGYAALRLGLSDSPDGVKPSFQVTLSEYNGDWKKMFGGFYRTEAMCYLPYDYNRQQTNRLIDYLHNDPLCQYLMRPTQTVIDRFNSQVRADGQIGDQYRGNGVTYRTVNGEVVLFKYTYGRDGQDQVFRNDPPISLYRAADVHMFIIEALVQLDRFEAAMILFEQGVESYFNQTESKFDPPVEDFPSCLFGAKQADRGASIRGRVTLAKVGDPILKNPSADVNEDRRKFDELVIEEYCMEFGGEGRSLYAMVRSAKRWNDPSFIADRVSAKYPEGKRQEIWNKLQSPTNWYIKYDLKNK